MATLEDKILGEKLHNYCSSSEDSDGGDTSEDEGGSKSKKCAKETEAPLPEPDKWEGTSSNTGPKGVIKDWQRFKQLETEKRVEDERERQELYQKLSMSVKSALQEEQEQAQNDPELAELLNDDFLLEYQKQRMQEMIQQTDHDLKFGQLYYLNNGQDYLDAIDKEDTKVKIIVHIYEDRVPACRAMNEALQELSKIYVNVKFCSIDVTRVGMSRDFKRNGIPALLIYKGGQIIGNFVQLTNDLGSEFDAEDVQAYLIEHGMLEDKSLKPLIVRNGDAADDSD